VATVSRIDEITGLFCRIWCFVLGSFAKEGYFHKTLFHFRDSYGGVATVSRIDEITGLFGRISSLSYGSFTKISYD